jgi:PAS domain S-box-containing protein
MAGRTREAVAAVRAGLHQCAGSQAADESLRQSKTRLEAAADLAGLGFYEVDFDKGATYLDDRFRDLCGVPPDREQGLQALQFWIEQLHPDDRSRVMDTRARLQGGEVDRLSLEYRFLHPAQGQKWIQHLAGVAARDAAGRAMGTYGVLRDITERKRAEGRGRRARARPRDPLQPHEKAGHPAPRAAGERGDVEAVK